MKSVGNIEKITAAMKMVAAAGVRTAEDAERRYAIMCIHNAGPHDEQALIERLRL